MFGIRNLGVRLLTALRPNRPITARRPATKFRFRPGLEGLDERIVPDSETWTNFGGDGLASNPANWSTYHAPNPFDSINFDGGVSNADCYGLDVDSLYVNMLNSTPSGILYTGTVTFTGTRTLTALVLETGTVAQAPGVDLSVNYGLQWLAPGVLNPNGSGSDTLHVLPNATANLDPMSGTIVTGDTLSFECTADVGAKVTVNPGAVQFNNAAGAIIGSAGVATRQVTLQLNPNTTLTTGGNGHITINSGGELYASGLGPITSQLPVANMGGVLKVDGGAIANFTGRLGGAGTSSVEQVSGNTEIEGGSTLKASFGMLLSTGKLSTIANMNPGGSQIATIDTGTFALTNNGADVVINDDAYNPPGVTSHIYGGELRCTNAVYWNGGTYRPVVNGTTKQADLWHTTSVFVVGQGAALAPGTINGGDIKAGKDNFLIPWGEAGIQGMAPTPTGGVSYSVDKDVPTTKWWLVKN